VAQVQTLESARRDPGTARQTSTVVKDTLLPALKEDVVMAIQRAMAVAATILIEAVLIFSVVLSNVGIAPAGQPTPGRIPAPITSR
jgi:hypothetical protein